MLRSLALLLLAAGVLAGQTSPSSAPAAAAPNPSPGATATTAVAPPANYRLQSQDQVSVHVLDMDEIGDRTLRVDSKGNVHLPLIGNVHLAGLTVDEAEAALAERVKIYVKDPSVTLNIVEFTPEIVSILGEVANPGNQPLHGATSLFQLISQVGGVREYAGTSIRITRAKAVGELKVQGVHEDESGQYWIAEVPLSSVIDLQDPKTNFPLRGGDVVTVPRGNVVYVVGDVTKAGKIDLGRANSISTLEAVSMSGGLLRYAAASRARILRTVPNSGDRKELQVDLRQIIAGKLTDVSMQPGDILIVPNSAGKVAMGTALQAIIGSGISSAIFVGTR